MNEIDDRITELESYFEGKVLPGAVELYAGTKIVDTAGFVKSHFSVLKSNGMKGIWEVFYIRLLRLKELL